ncbi:peptidase A4 family-domain-containing protein [Boletus edulis]|nr:peptidase A4 family-domain-containing protein [Boletus edulis]
MRLNSALASSFLFVPIVLADYRPGEHQPRFSNSVNKNINDAWVDQVPWAGAVLPESNEGGYTAAIGSFKVPSASGNLGIAIMVGIGGRGAQCSTTFAAGVNVLVTSNSNVVSYAGWATWGDRTVSANIGISSGDTIRASVYLHSATIGDVLLENLTNGETFWDYFITNEPAVCQRSAEWVVTPLANYPPNEKPIPKFGEVTFEDATAKFASEASVMPGPGANIINEIKFNNTLLTTATVYKSTVVIASTT